MSIDSQSLQTYLSTLPIVLQYLVLFGLNILEGSVITMVAGFIARVGQLHFVIALCVMILGDIVSDIGYFYIGRHAQKLRPTWLGKLVGLQSSMLDKFEVLYKKHGTKAIVIAKLTDGLAVSAILLAGYTRMTLRRFVGISVPTAIGKALILFIIGYEFGAAIGAAEKAIRSISTASVLLALFILTSLLFRHIVSSQNEANTQNHRKIPAKHRS